MKNKLLKTLACFAGIFTIGSTIAITSTSCGSSNSAKNILPESVYKFSEDGKTLLGFQDAFLNDPTSPIYKDNFQDCDTMEIPVRVETISSNAFNSSEREVIPSYITKLTFAKQSNCSSIGSNAFNSCSALTSVTFPSSLTQINAKVFYRCWKLNNIEWNAWTGNITLDATSFSSICQTSGTVTVIDPIDEAHDSVKLLNTLIDSAGLSIDWGLVLPDTVYDIDYDTDSSKRLYGFSAAFLSNPSRYSDYRIMEIPAEVEIINTTAFYNATAKKTKIPSYIKKLTFQKQSALISIQGGAFSSGINNASPLKSVDLINCSNLQSIYDQAFYACPLLSSIYLPGSLNYFNPEVFWNCSSLKLIVWDGISANPTIYDKCFEGVAASGTVKLTNPVEGYTSNDLLTFLQSKGWLANWNAV